VGLKEAVRYALNEAGKQKALTEATGLSRQTYYDVLNDKQKNGPTWATVLAMADGAADKHIFAHLIFDLEPPEKMMELEGPLREICKMVLLLDEDARRELMGYIKRMLDEGGIDRSSAAGAEYG